MADQRMMLRLICLCSLAVMSQAVTLSTYFNEADIERFKNVFLQPYNNDLHELEFTIYGLTLLEVPLPEPQKICETVKKNINVDDLESLYYSIYAVNALKTSGTPCDVSFASAETKLRNAISPESSTRHILYAVRGLGWLGQKIDSAKLVAALEGALKADDTPFSYSCVFYAACYLTAPADIKKFHDMIEDIVAQADEIDDKYLQFEGGLMPTATVIYTAYKLSGVAKIAPTISEDKVVKFANYLLSRKHTQSKLESVFLVSAVKILTNNKFHVPVAVSLASQVSVSPKSPVIQVRVCNLMGKSLGKLTVSADTARHVGDEAVVLSKKSFTASSDPSLFELDLMKVNPKRGFYLITMSVSAVQPTGKLLGANGAEVEVKVTTQIVIENVELSVADKDQSSAPKTNKMQYPGKVDIEADHHQRLVLKFSLKEESSKQTITAHQTFVRLTNINTNQEVIFVAEDEGSAYKFDLDIGLKSKDFKNLSGKYSMDLIVGDAVIENPISWKLGEVKLTFHDDPVVSTSNQYRFTPKPEISHMFREPEKRPPATVSNLFTGLVLLPILVLFILWMKIGVNISNFPFSLSALGFHLGLCAIFGLYFCYFLKLTMFETLRYLGLIGIPTFLFGHRLLSGIAAKGWKPKDR